MCAYGVKSLFFFVKLINILFLIEKNQELLLNFVIHVVDVYSTSDKLWSQQWALSKTAPGTKLLGVGCTFLLRTQWPQAAQVLAALSRNMPVLSLT